MAGDVEQDYFERQFAAIERRTAAADARRRRRTGWSLAGGGLAVSLALTGSTIAVIQASMTEKSVSLCYQNASLSAPSTGVGTAEDDGTVAPESTMAGRVSLAEEQCGAVWRIGMFTEEGPAGDQEQPVPALFTCELRDGRLGVFPVEGDADCAGLGLREP